MLMNVNQAAKAPSNENIGFLPILKGITISYIVTIPTFMIFALILTNTDFPEKFTSPVVIITTIISVLIAGSTATKGLKNKGWLNGSVVGFIYMFILYILSSIIFKTFVIDKYVITMTIIGVLTGAIGGIIGINFKKSTRIRRFKG
jgi:putative membrane protein (TIGR04086 family)